jgi:hypothetical protein
MHMIFVTKVKHFFVSIMPLMKCLPQIHVMHTHNFRPSFQSWKTLKTITLTIEMTMQMIFLRIFPFYFKWLIPSTFIQC